MKNKNNGKKLHDPIRALSVKFIAQQFHVTESYVRAAISGTAKGGQVDDIIKEYTLKYSQGKSAFSK